MKAVIITRPGGTEVLELEDRPLPQLAAGEIRVRVRASALNRADILQRQGNYPVPPGAPADIAGIEYAGEVDALGESVMLWKPGDRVMGIVGGGAHAEYVVLNEREAIRAPKAMSWENAAAIPEAFLTAYDALFARLNLRPGETLLIHAVGSGVGTAGLQLAKTIDARVIGTARSAGKLERANQLGLDAAVDASRGDWVAEVQKIAGTDAVSAVLDLVGGNYLDGNLRVLATRGRIVIVGLTAGAIAPMNMGILLRKRATMIGTVLRARPLEEKTALAREFSDRIVPFFESGRLKPIVDRVFSFAEISAAHQLMESNASFGKIVLVW